MSVDTENFAKNIREDLVFLLLLSKEELEDVVDIFLEFTKKTSERSLDEITDRLLKVNKIDEEGVSRIMKLMGVIGTVCTDEYKTEVFLKRVKPWIKPEESVRKLEVFLKQLSDKGVINGIFKLSKQMELESTGLPRFVLLDIRTDYRMFADLQGKKEIVPMILFNIIVRQSHIGQEEQIAFQASQEDLHDIIEQLNSFSDNLQKEINYLRDKSLSLVG